MAETTRSFPSNISLINQSNTTSATELISSYFYTTKQINIINIINITNTKLLDNNNDINDDIPKLLNNINLLWYICIILFISLCCVTFLFLFYITKKSKYNNKYIERPSKLSFNVSPELNQNNKNNHLNLRKPIFKLSLGRSIANSFTYIDKTNKNGNINTRSLSPTKEQKTFIIKNQKQKTKYQYKIRQISIPSPTPDPDVDLDVNLSPNLNNNTNNNYDLSPLSIPITDMNNNNTDTCNVHINISPTTKRVLSSNKYNNDNKAPPPTPITLDSSNISILVHEPSINTNTNNATYILSPPSSINTQIIPLSASLNSRQSVITLSTIPSVPDNNSLIGNDSKMNTIFKKIKHKLWNELNSPQSDNDLNQEPSIYIDDMMISK